MLILYQTCRCWVSFKIVVKCYYLEKGDCLLPVVWGKARKMVWKENFFSGCIFCLLSLTIEQYHLPSRGILGAIVGWNFTASTAAFMRESGGWLSMTDLAMDNRARTCKKIIAIIKLLFKHAYTRLCQKTRAIVCLLKEG